MANEAVDAMLSVSEPAAANDDAERLDLSNKLGVPVNALPKDLTATRAYAKQKFATDTLSPNAKEYLGQNPELVNIAASDPRAVNDVDAALGAWRAANRGPVGNFISGFNTSERQFKENALALERLAGVEGAAERQAELFKLDVQNGPDEGFWATAGSLLSQTVHYGTSAGFGAIVGGVAASPTGPGAIPGAIVGAGTGLSTQMAYDANAQAQADADRLEHQYGIEIGAGTRALWSIANVGGTLLVDKLAGGKPGVASAVAKQAANDLLVPLAQRESASEIALAAGKALATDMGKSGVQMAAFSAVNAYTEQMARAGNNLPSILNDPDQRTALWEGLFHAATLGAILGTPAGVMGLRDSVSMSRMRNKLIESQQAFEQMQTKLEALPPTVREKFADDNLDFKIEVPKYRIDELYQGRDYNDPLGPLANVDGLKDRVKSSAGGVLNLKPSEYMALDPAVQKELRDHVRMDGEYPSMFHLNMLEDIKKATPEVDALRTMFEEMLDGQKDRSTPEADILSRALNDKLSPEEKIKVATDAIHAGMPEVHDYLLGTAKAKSEALAETDVRTIKPEDIDRSDKKGVQLSPEAWLKAENADNDLVLRELSKLTDFSTDKDGNLTIAGKTAKDSNLTATEAKILLQAKVKATRLFTSRFIENPATLGMGKELYRRYATELLKEQNAMIDAAKRGAETIEARKMRKEWKAEREDLRPLAENYFNNEPGWRAYEMIKKDKNLKLNAQNIDDMWPTPFGLKDGSSIYASDLLRGLLDDHGMPPGLLAMHPEIRLQSGKELVTRILVDEILRREAGESRKEYFNRRVEEKMDQYMEDRHGADLNMLIEEAVDSAAKSTPRMIIVSHELRGLANMVGLGEMVTTDGLKQAARLAFDAVKFSDAIKVSQFDHAAEVAARRVEMALLKKDIHTAWLAKQEQYNNLLQSALAAEAKKIKDKFEKRINSVIEEPMPHGYDHDLASSAQILLNGLGYVTNRSVEDALTKVDGARPSTLVDWAVKSYQLPAPEVYASVADKIHYSIVQGKTVDFDNMPWGEANMAIRSISAMLALARKVEAIESDSRREAREFHGSRIREQTDKDRMALQGDGLIPRLLRGADQWLKMMPALAQRIDQGDTNGPFHKLILRPMQEASTEMQTLRNNLAEHAKENWPAPLKPKELKEEFSNYLLGDHERPGEYLKLDRANLRGMMLHIGNESNMHYLIEGMNQRIEDPAFRWTEDKVMNLVNRFAKKEDFDYVQAVWDTYQKFWPDLQAMAHRTVGWAPDAIEPREIVNAHGKYKGGYAPIIYDSNAVLPSTTGFFGNDWFSTTPSSRHLKDRVQVMGPLSLEDNTQLGMETVMRDLAFREPVRNVLPLVQNEDFLAGMKDHYGPEFNQGFFEQWLKDTVGITDKHFTEGHAIVDVINKARRNYMAAQLVLSASTLVKHGSAAGMNSIAELLLKPGGTAKIPAFLQNVAGQYFEKLARHVEYPEAQILDMNFVYENSEYMRNRSHVGMDAFSGAMKDYAGEGTSFLDKVNEWGGKAYNFIDQASAVPLWMVEYEMARDAGKSHVDAAYAADQKVIMAHGDPQGVNASAIIRGTRRSNDFSAVALRELSFIYGFFNHMYNRDSDWLISRPIDMLTGHDHYELGGMSTAGKIATYALFYGYFTGLVKNLDSSLRGDHDNKDESEAKEVVKILIHRFGGDLPIARQILSSFMEGFDGGAPVVEIPKKVLSAAKQIYDATNEGDPSKIKAKTMVNAVGQTLGIPGSGQLGKTLDALPDGRHPHIGNYLFGGPIHK